MTFYYLDPHHFVLLFMCSTNQCHSAASLGMVNAGFANDDFRQMKDLVDGYGVIQPPSYESHISAYDGNV